MNEKGCVITPKKLLIIKKMIFQLLMSNEIRPKKMPKRLVGHLIVFLKRLSIIFLDLGLDFFFQFVGQFWIVFY